MKAILDILHKWCNWNSRRVDNVYRFVTTDNFLCVWGGGTFFSGTATVHAIIDGTEQELTYTAISSYPLTKANVTPGTICKVSWDDSMRSLIVNDRLIFGSLPSSQYKTQQKTDTIQIEKNSNDPTYEDLVLRYTKSDGTGVEVEMYGSEHTFTDSAKIGSPVVLSWAGSRVTYLKLNDIVLVS